MVSVYNNLEGWDKMDLWLILFDTVTADKLWQEYVDGRT